MSATPLDFIQSLAPAKKALEISSAASLEQRAVWLNSIADRLESQESALAAEEARTDGWPVDLVLEKSVRPLRRLFLRTARELTETAPRHQARPTGLVLIVAPAPFGFRVIGERLAPALAAGNAVFIKTSLKSSAASAMWKSLLAGLPSGLVTVLQGSGAELGSLMVAHPSIRAVSFAGRPATAMKVAQSAVGAWKKMQISAGVKNSLMILPDADLNRLPNILEGALHGQGRLGWSLSRIFVTETQAEEFFTRLAEFLRGLPARGPGCELLSGLRTRAIADKAKIIFDGPPLVLRDLSNCSTLQLDELDQDVIIVNTVKYTHEMAKWTNTADFGFAASIWGSDEKARRLAEKLQVGRVWINGWMEGDEAFAGLKKSFLGTPDYSWDGSFFSDVKTLTPSES